jgi:hypothetical protein
VGQLFLGVGDGVQDFLQRPLTAADGAQVGTVRFGNGQRDAPGAEQFDALQPEPQGVQCQPLCVSKSIQPRTTRTPTLSPPTNAPVERADPYRTPVLYAVAVAELAEFSLLAGA